MNEKKRQRIIRELNEDFEWGELADMSNGLEWLYKNDVPGAWDLLDLIDDAMFYGDELNGL